jgi:hypothetical protein
MSASIKSFRKSRPLYSKAIKIYPGAPNANAGHTAPAAPLSKQQKARQAAAARRAAKATE